MGVNMLLKGNVVLEINEEGCKTNIDADEISIAAMLMSLVSTIKIQPHLNEENIRYIVEQGLKMSKDKCENQELLKAIAAKMLNQKKEGLKKNIHY